MSALAERCVLIVEDEYYLATDVVRCLHGQGAGAIGPCPGKAEAFAALDRERPDCAILDINLGSGTDFELADALRQRRVPFLFFTGYDHDVIPPRFADVVRLEKPVGDAQLLRAIEALCNPR